MFKRIDPGRAARWRSALAGCGDDGGGGGGGRGGRRPRTLTIYSSLPLQGAARAQSAAAVNGAKLALEQAGGKAGKFPVKYVSLDDSTAQAGGWEPNATSANARKAVGDDSTIGYIGEFNSGGDRGLAADPQRGRDRAGQPGQHRRRHHLRRPRRRRPASRTSTTRPGKRTYARVLPKDTYQGAALVTLAKEKGCASAYILNDKEVYGAGPGQERRAGRRRSRAWRSRATTGSTRTPPTTARSRSGSRAPARSASSTAASRPTTRSRSSRTSRSRCPTRR